MKRVVINGRFLTQRGTGVQRYSRETLLALDVLLERSPVDGVEFVLAVPGGVTAPKLASIRVAALPWLRGHLWEQMTLPAFARGDLLVNFNYSAPLVKRNQLITLHDATVRAVPHCFSRSYRLVQDTLIAGLRSRVAAIMTVSSFSARELRTHYSIDRKMVVGREGWSHALARGDAGAILGKHGLTPGDYLLTVGSLKPNKNLEVVARALALTPVPWTVAVAGAADSRIFRDSQQKPGHLRFLGFVPDEELGVLYANAAWFLFPSLYEGFGLPALEAMANGCPIIAANAGSLPEVCADAALYFDPVNPTALAALLSGVARDAEERERLRRAAVPRLAHYTWTANARIVLGEILSTLGLPDLEASIDAEITAGELR
jgi:glycosyltransferase involved in cell wall biosynthesis